MREKRGKRKGSSFKSTEKKEGGGKRKIKGGAKVKARDIFSYNRGRKGGGKRVSSFLL